MIYSVWMEGYRTNGESANATYVGTGAGNTFQEACKDALEESNYDMSFYSEENNSYWACKLFDNQMSARANFG